MAVYDEENVSLDIAMTQHWKTSSLDATSNKITEILPLLSKLVSESITYRVQFTHRHCTGKMKNIGMMVENKIHT